MTKKIKIIYTDHFINKTVTNAFAKGCAGESVHVNNHVTKKNELIATYGILRGTGDILKLSKNFWYIDHGYFGSSKRIFSNRTNIINLDGYFRVVQNDFLHSGEGNCKSDRFDKLNIKCQPIRKSGEYIILSEPSEYVKKFYDLNDWINNTIIKLEKYTDRKIYVHNKNSNIKLSDLLNKAWAFVSEQSTAGFQAMAQGVPAHYTYKTLKKINSLEEIESGKIDSKLF